MAMSEESEEEVAETHPLLVGIREEDRVDMLIALQYMHGVILPHGQAGTPHPPSPPGFARGTKPWFFYVLACFKAWPAVSSSI